MCKEERFEYEGYGIPSFKRTSMTKGATKFLFVDVEAVLPILKETPVLNRFEYEVARRSYGWESLGSVEVRAGWRKRLGEICVGFDHAFVFASADDRERADTLTKAMRVYMTGARATWWRLRAREYEREIEGLVDAFSECVVSMRHRGYHVNEITAYLNQCEYETDELRTEFARREPALTLHLHQVHPVLGLFSTRLPLPEDFDALDDWLESKAPLPGTINPGAHE